jgi:hypothetical protein
MLHCREKNKCLNKFRVGTEHPSVKLCPKIVLHCAEPDCLRAGCSGTDCAGVDSVGLDRTCTHVVVSSTCRGILCMHDFLHN